MEFWQLEGWALEKRTATVSRPDCIAYGPERYSEVESSNVGEPTVRGNYINNNVVSIYDKIKICGSSIGDFKMMVYRAIYNYHNIRNSWRSENDILGQTPRDK